MSDRIKSLHSLGFEGIYKNYNKNQLQDIYEELYGIRPSESKKHEELACTLWNYVRSVTRNAGSY